MPCETSAVLQGNIVDQAISKSPAISAAFFNDILGVSSPYATPSSSYWQGLSMLNARQTALLGDNCSPYDAQIDPAALFAGSANLITNGVWLDPAAQQNNLIDFMTGLLQAIIGGGAAS
jgi:hypothetical protein